MAEKSQLSVVVMWIATVKLKYGNVQKKMHVHEVTVNEFW